MKDRNLETNKQNNKSKNKSGFNFKSLTVPLFIVLGINLMFSLGLGLYTKYSTPATVVQNNTIATQNVNVNNGSALLLKAIENLKYANNVIIKSSGEIKAFTTQKIKITKMFDGVTHFSENITTGLKNAANRIYYTKDYAVVNVRGTNISETGATWNGKVSNYTYDEFVKKFHIAPDAMLPYEINYLTITSSTKPVKKGNYYEFTVNLNPTLATKNYAKNLQTLTKLNNEFNFKEVVLDVVLNEDFNFVNVTVKEKYEIKVLGITKECTSNIKTNFDFKTKAIIPTV